MSLAETLKGKKSIIVAVDFDGTLCKHEYPRIGMAYLGIVGMLKTMRTNGHKIILWTCRNGKELTEAIEWCKNLGLEFDAVNDDVEAIKNSDFGKYKSNKIYADVYLDDRALTVQVPKRKKEAEIVKPEEEGNG